MYVYVTSKISTETWVQEYRGDLGIALYGCGVGWMHSCVILTCTLPSCLMACAMTVATRMNGAIKPMLTIKS